MTMMPPGITKADRNTRIDRLRADGLVRVETLRLQYHAPLIWNSEYQQEQFRTGNRYVVECVDKFVNYFALNYRPVLRATLTNGLTLRRETLESYR